MLAMPPTSLPPMALGCPVSENGPMPGRPIRPGEQMAVDDAVHLVRAGGRLIHTLRERSDDALSGGKQLVELLETLGIDSTGARDALNVWRRASATSKAALAPVGMRGHESGVCQTVPPQPGQQAVEQEHVGARAHRQVQVGDLSGRRAPRIDDDELELRATLLFGRRCAGTEPDDTRPCSTR